MADGRTTRDDESHLQVLCQAAHRHAQTRLKRLEKPAVAHGEARPPRLALVHEACLRTVALSQSGWSDDPLLSSAHQESSDAGKRQLRQLGGEEGA